MRLDKRGEDSQEGGAGDYSAGAMFFFPGPDSRSYAVGSVAPWKKTSLASVTVSPAKAAAHNGDLGENFL